MPVSRCPSFEPMYEYSFGTKRKRIKRCSENEIYARACVYIGTIASLLSGSVTAAERYISYRTNISFVLRKHYCQITTLSVGGLFRNIARGNVTERHIVTTNESKRTKRRLSTISTYRSVRLVAFVGWIITYVRTIRFSACFERYVNFSSPPPKNKTLHTTPAYRGYRYRYYFVVLRP